MIKTDMIYFTHLLHAIKKKPNKQAKIFLKCKQKPTVLRFAGSFDR